jgi:hypothetical protein
MRLRRLLACRVPAVARTIEATGISRQADAIVGQNALAQILTPNLREIGDLVQGSTRRNHSYRTLCFQRAFFFSFLATRASIIFFKRAAGSGLSTGKRMVPFDVEKPFKSLANLTRSDASIGNRLQ